MKKAGWPPCPKSLILLVEQRGVEPLTSALRTRRSAKLSYCPTRIDILGSAVDQCQATTELTRQNACSLAGSPNGSTERIETATALKRQNEKQIGRASCRERV